MDSDNKHKRAERIFAESTCLNRNMLIGYVEDTLSPQEKHAAESHLVDCELCSDAVEGFMEGSASKNIVAADSLLEDINILAAPAPSQHSQVWIRIAAGAAILVLAGSSFFLIGRFTGPDHQIAAVQEIPIEETAKPGQEIFQFGTEHASTIKADEPIELEEFDKDLADKEPSIPNIEPTTTMQAPLASTSERKVTSPKKNKQGRIVMSDEFFHIKEVPVEEKAKSVKPMPASVDAAGDEPEIIFSKAVASLPTEFEKAMENYNNGNYSASGRGFKKVLEQEPNNSDALYYGGISYLNTNKAGKAISNFDKITKNRSDKYYEDARWEKARALLKKGRIEDARRLLNAIVYSNGKYRAAAQKALEEMN